jgi:hypothetical protein
VYILSVGGEHVTSPESNSPIIIASENFRDQSCVCIAVFGKERLEYTCEFDFRK